MRHCVVAIMALVLSSLLGGRSLVLAQNGYANGNAEHPKIMSFSVKTPDITLAYPNTVDLDLPDEHTTLLPILPWQWPFEQT